MNTPDAQRPRSEILRRTILVLVSVVIGLGLIELGVRASTWTWLFAWPNYVLDARKVLARTDNGRSMHDDRLGYRPRPGHVAPGVTIDAEGLRTTGPAPAGDQPPILAVGDSFTFGEEVADGESWPADLQRFTGRRVLNAGVSGYGFDQIVLRAEALAPVYKPGAIVVAFIADDIRRTEMRRLWSADKPYFEPEGDGLVLRNVPVPPRAPPETTLTFWQRTIGYSYAFDFLMRRLGLLHDWFGDHIRVHEEGTGELVSCRLTARLAGLQKQSGAPVLLVAAYDPVVWDDPKFAAEQRRLTAGLLDCARRNGLGTLDTFEALAATTRPRDLYVLWHMNAAGNVLMAKLIAGALGDKAR